MPLNLLVVAPAGCGKTEALALRVQGLIKNKIITSPKKILVTTFSNRARDNINERLRRYLPLSVIRERVSVVNFHGLSARIIRAHSNVIGLQNDLILPENDWIGEQLRKRDIPWNEKGPIQEALRVTKQKPLDDQAVELELLGLRNTDAVDIERLRKKEKRLTYDDLPRLAELILQNKIVADLYSTHFGAIIVDEYQDLTPQQLRIVNLIGYGRTTYAGDLAQGIYGFAGAQPDEVDQSIRSECSAIIELSESHRSSPAVLEMTNSLIPLTTGTTLTSANPNLWTSGGLSCVVSHQSVEDEADWIEEWSRKILNKSSSQRIGILTRTANRRRFVDERFASANIPYFRWDDGVLDTDTAKLIKSMLSRLDFFSYDKSPDKVEFLRDKVGFNLITDVDVRKNTSEALDWVQDRLSEGLSISEIRKRIKVGGSSTLITSSGVHLLSGHVGKGQQFDWVFVVGVEEDSIPFSFSTTHEEIQEEARILSVMISRARYGVILSRSVSVPTSKGYSKKHPASRFLKYIAAAQPFDENGMVEWFENLNWDEVNSINKG